MAPSHRYGQLIAAISIAFLPSCAEAAPRQYEAVQKHWSEKDRDTGKIIEGRDVAPSTHEWQVGILRTDISEVFFALYCGGSHLGSGWVVTAAHCITDLQPKDIDVYAGSLTLDSGGKRYAVQKVIAHPHYNEETMVADIALIRVADLAVGAIDLVNQSVNTSTMKPSSDISVSGWGVTDTVENRKSNFLKEVTLPFQTNAICNGPESYNHAIKPDMFCLGRMAGGADACTYDSGGPATTAGQSKPTLVGVVSFGDDCGQPKKFGVYTRILPYREWIEKTIASQPR
jgi:secreted trypsin-like serine protease